MDIFPKTSKQTTGPGKVLSITQQQENEKQTPEDTTPCTCKTGGDREDKR